jgi:Siphovirus Gp157
VSAPALALVPKRFSLYEHVRDVEGIADLVEALDAAGELTPQTQEQLEHALCAAIAGTKEKIDRTTCVLAQFEAAEAAAKTERDRLDVRAKYFARQRERLEDYCMAVLTASKLPRIDGNTSSISVRKNPAKLVIDDAMEIPWEYMTLPEPPPAEPDNAAIKAALKNGVEVSGARLVQTSRMVRS